MEPWKGWRRGILWMWVAVGVGLLARCMILLLSEGSDDIFAWASFADHIREFGLAETYRQRHHFNHPPLMGYWAVAARDIAHVLGCRFAVIFKLPCLLADIFAGWLLWRIALEPGGRRACWVVGLYALNPITAAVGCFHGNTDILGATGLLAGAFALERRRWVWAGLALAAALNVKVIPLFGVLPLLFLVEAPRDLWRFWAALSVGCLPYLPFLMSCHAEMARNILAYGSHPNPWGVRFLIQITDGPLHDRLRLFYFGFAAWVVWVELYLCVFFGMLAARVRRLSAYELSAWGISLFLVLAPGFGIQYVIYPVALLFASSLKHAVAYSVTAGVFAVWLYVGNWTGTWPAAALFRSAYGVVPSWFGFASWAVLVWFGLDVAWRLVRRSGRRDTEGERVS